MPIAGYMTVKTGWRITVTQNWNKWFT